MIDETPSVFHTTREKNDRCIMSIHGFHVSTDFRVKSEWFRNSNYRQKQTLP